ncbi:MAG: SIR2 family protein, partial [Thermoanaerobaculia bacterium]|nr:SIR2 family protein [Thermoanaerobaculia bacterium]
MDLFDSSAFEERLLSAHADGRPVVFLVGSGLTCPTAAGNPGVASVATVTARARDLLGTMAPASLSPGADGYQEVLRAVQGSRGPEAINRLVREAVLESCPGGPSDLRARAVRGDEAACDALAKEPTWWALRAGITALGELAVLAPEIYGRVVLTTNFDPLISVALRKAGARFYETLLPTDLSLEQTRAEGCHVVHAHGYWSGSDTLHLPAQLEQPRPRFEASLRRLFGQACLVVLGYGGWADGFTRALFNVLEDGGAFPEVLWAFYSTNEVDIRRNYASLLRRLEAGALRLRVTFYQGIDSDLVLPRIVQRLRVPAAPPPPPPTPPQTPPLSPGAPKTQ